MGSQKQLVLSNCKYVVELESLQKKLAQENHIGYVVFKNKTKLYFDGIKFKYDR